MEVKKPKVHEEHAIGGQTVFEIFGIGISNTLLAAILSTFLVMLIGLGVKRSLSGKKSTVGTLFRMGYEYFFGMAKGMLGAAKAKVVTPWVFTMFIFILISNWMGLVPGMASLEIDFHGHAVPIIKPATSDFSVTFALGAVSYILINFLAFKYVKKSGWFHHYFHLPNKKETAGAMFGLLFFVGVYVGLLEIILEPVKSLSLALRLFGNVTAGESLINGVTVFGETILPFTAIPFMLLEIIVGVVQATVFSVLTLSFIAVFIQGDHSESHSESHA